MKKNIKVNIEYLTRVEGHGNIVINVTNGELKECRLDIVEAPRFFEAMLCGRSIFEAQHITSRICGICSCGHTLASLQAAEDALKLQVSNQTVELRKLLLNIEILDSHILHIYLLVAPDLLGVKSFVPLIESHNDVVRRALRMKKNCNNICDILTGRHVHPISAVIGGFTKLPTTDNIKTMIKLLKDLKQDLDITKDLFKNLEFPDFDRETEYVALVNDSENYPLLSGNIGSSDGVLKKKYDYKKITNEFIVPHSSAKHTKLSRESYAVGSLARLNLNKNKLHKNAKKVLNEFNFNQIITNPYLNTVAQLIECYHCIDDSINILNIFLKNGINYSEEIIVGINEKSRIDIKAGQGVGAVEVPRGILFHDYEIDDNGIIINANCIIPTNQNINNIEQDMKKLVPEIIDKNKDEIKLYLEMLVRSYDPCISCSAHFLGVEFVNE